MAETIISGVLGQLNSIIGQQILQEVKLVVGVDKEVKKLTSNLEAIEAVVFDVEERQVKEKTVRLWLDWLKHTSYDIDDVLDEWNYAMLKQQIEGAASVPKKKVCFFFPSSCFSFKQMSLLHDIEIKIKEVNEHLDDIEKQKDMYNFKVSRGVGKSDRVQSTSFIDVSNIYGRVEDKNTLVYMLCESSEHHPHIISIIGMGGIVKITLAQFASKDNKVINNFDQVMWVCVSEPFDEYRIAKAIIEALEDDYKKWEPLYYCLKNGLYGSKILINTRKESMARMMESIDIIAVKELPGEEWIPFPDSICSLKRLRSFLRDLEDFKHSLPCNIIPKLFDELTCLKALRIGGRVRQFGNNIDNIPKEIGKLIHLRYLDLKELEMRKLPEELCGLYNLQTLDISFCQKLEELSQGFGKLINLRHLENDEVWSLRYIPMGIQKLINLQTLKLFVVSGVDSNDDKACSLEDLKNINLYGDDLCIHKLGNVSNVDEARRLELKNRKNLLHLSLDFRKDGGERINEDEEALLEILQPPLNLEKLLLADYRGNFILPN
ncbi:putative disease resistance protein RGA4 [Pistacia vera]|uniref:putative disease resistance protein RGA4 n=1 Tax=Pistacia vera TaxID=55513 RepID=UPI0012633EC1|nr:putative disease resistance protein RGA4 [Pistacia vera]